MSKYNLTDILNEYIGGGRIGTLKISYRDLVDKMDELEKSGKVIVREIPGPSGDGKSNREFEVIDRDSAVAGGKKQERGFTVYDYKFGFDPGDIDNYEEEYDFSVGGNDIDLAMKLIDGVKPFNMEESKRVDEGYIGDENYQDQKGSADQKLWVLSKLIDAGILKGYPSNEYKKALKAVDHVSAGDINEEVSDENYVKGLQLVQKILSKEGGAAGLKPIYDALKDLGFKKEEVVDLLKKMTKVKKHRDGDYILLPLEEGHGLDQGDVDFLQSFIDRMGFDKEPVDAKEFTKLKKILKFILKSNILQDKTMDLSKGKANVDEVMDIDRKGRKKKESKSNMTKVNEAVAEEESVADYIIDYYRNPNKPEETMVDEKIVGEYFRTHEDWDMIWGKSYEDGMDDFQEFFDINYGIMFDDSRDIDEIDINTVQNDPGSGDADNPEGEELEASSGYDAAMESLKEHFNRFK